MSKSTIRIDKDLRDQPGDYMPWKAVGKHICPVNDLRQHLLHDCWCDPHDDEGFIVHHSLDGRELYESGERKLS